MGRNPLIRDTINSVTRGKRGLILNSNWVMGNVIKLHVCTPTFYTVFWLSHSCTLDTRSLAHVCKPFVCGVWKPKGSEKWRIPPGKYTQHIRDKNQSDPSFGPSPPMKPVLRSPQREFAASRWGAGALFLGLTLMLTNALFKWLISQHVRIGVKSEPQSSSSEPEIKGFRPCPAWPSAWVGEGSHLPGWLCGSRRQRMVFLAVHTWQRALQLWRWTMFTSCFSPKVRFPTRRPIRLRTAAWRQRPASCPNQASCHPNGRRRFGKFPENHANGLDQNIFNTNLFLN